MKIALIGKAGTGKSTLAKLFWTIGWTVIHCDDEVHKSYTESRAVRNYLVHLFGAEIFDNRNETINRKKLAKILADNSQYRELLENFLYKVIFKPLINEASKHHKNVLIDGILPRFATKGFDLVLCAWIDDKKRMRRLQKRGVSKRQIQYINQIQKDWKLPC